MESTEIRCAACGQLNRLPPLAEGKKAVCGRCKAPLQAAGEMRRLTDADFDAAISRGRFVVDFWAAWCGPCRTIAPMLDELARERPAVSFAKLNVDENPRVAARFSVQGIPLLIFFRDGVEQGRVVGAVPKGQIAAAIDRYLER